MQHFFKDTAANKYGSLLATPQATTIPSQWILSSGGRSNLIAAKFGMGLSIPNLLGSPHILLLKSKKRKVEKFT